MRTASVILATLLCLPATAQNPLNVVNTVPPQAPAWPEGYQVRWPVRVIGTAGQQPARTVLVSLPTGGWLRPDAGDLMVVGPAGKPLDFLVHSHSTLGDTLIQFRRVGQENWYWVFGRYPDQKGPPAALDAHKDPDFHEGMVLESRAFNGKMGGWADVRAEMERQPQVLTNAVVTELNQNCNPAAPDVNQNFAVSYRGYLRMPKDGVYRFFLNGEGSTFLFIDGFKVHERAGASRPVTGKITVAELDRIAGKIELKAGVHLVEAHQAIGALSGGEGILGLNWSPPGEKKFAVVPQSAYVQPLYAWAAGAEFRPGMSGVQFEFGIDDVLEVGGIKLFVVRFEAAGPIADAAKIVWDMGDGTHRQGRSIAHVYFKEGNFEVAVQGGTLPAFRRQVHLWPEPGAMTPLSLDNAVAALAAMDWKKLDINRVRDMFSFLQACEQTDRWALLERVVSYLLDQKDVDLEVRAELWSRPGSRCSPGSASRRTRRPWAGPCSQSLPNRRPWPSGSSSRPRPSISTS